MLETCSVQVATSADLADGGMKARGYCVSAIGRSRRVRNTSLQNLSAGIHTISIVAPSDLDRVREATMRQRPLFGNQAELGSE